MLKKNIFCNTTINYIGKFFSFLIQFIIITLLINFYGKMVYGIIVLGLSLVANTNILESGIGLSVTKYIAQYKINNNWKKINETISISFFINTIISLFFFIIILIVNEFFLNSIFNIPQNLIYESKIFIRILSFSIVTELWVIVLMRISEGFQNFFLARLVEFFKWLFRLILILIIYNFDNSLKTIGLAYLTASILNFLIFFRIVIVKNKNIKLKLFYWNKTKFFEILSFSTWIFLSKIFAFISYRIDVIIIGIFLTPVYMTYYNIGYKIYETLKLGISIIASTLIPLTSQLKAKYEKFKIKLLYIKATKLSIGFIFPVLIAFYFYSDKLINFWVGQRYDISYNIVKLFIISLFFNVITLNGAEMVIGMNKLKKLIKFNAIGTFINLFISLIFIIKLKVYSVVIGTIIGNILICSGYIYIFNKIFDLKFSEFLQKIFLKNILVNLFLFIFFMYFKNNIYLIFFIYVVYLFFLVFYLFDKEEKIFIKYLNI